MSEKIPISNVASLRLREGLTQRERVAKLCEALNCSPSELLN